MKKRILSIVMVALLLTSLLLVSSCGLPSMLKRMGAEHSFGYSGCFTYPSFSEMRSNLIFVYSDTTLHLYGDGTWTIEMNDPSIFVDGVLDQGSYTVEDGVYTFDGFEYGFDAKGEMGEEEFSIYFNEPGTGEGVFSLHFEN